MMISLSFLGHPDALEPIILIKYCAHGDASEAPFSLRVRASAFNALLSAAEGTGSVELSPDPVGDLVFKWRGNENPSSPSSSSLPIVSRNS